MKQKEILIYHWYFCQIGGVETFLYNFCLNLCNYYDIKIIYNDGDANQIRRIRRYAKLEKYDPNKKYECDIFIRNSVWGLVPNNIYSRENRYLELRHANYMFLKEKGFLFQQYQPYEKTNEIIACSEFVAEMSHKALGDNPYTILNILEPKKETNKILHFISITRLDEYKGVGRMKKLIEMLNSANIKFDWKIFTNSKPLIENENVHFYKQRFDMWDYLADADYSILLSDSEGCPYTVQESLQYKVPCIVTDIGGCTELVKDGINGYVVPLNMEFDVKKLLKIPKLKDYNNHALEKWIDYLGGAIYKERKDEERMFKLEVLRTIDYSNFDNLVDIIRKDKAVDIKGKIMQGDIIVVKGREEADYLCGDNSQNLIACKLIEELEVATKVKDKLETAVKPKRKAKKKNE